MIKLGHGVDVGVKVRGVKQGKEQKERAGTGKGGTNADQEGNCWGGEIESITRGNKEERTMENCKDVRSAGKKDHSAKSRRK